MKTTIIVIIFMVLSASLVMGFDHEINSYISIEKPTMKHTYTFYEDEIKMILMEYLKGFKDIPSGGVSINIKEPNYEVFWLLSDPLPRKDIEPHIEYEITIPVKMIIEPVGATQTK